MTSPATIPLRSDEQRLRAIDAQKRWEAAAAERGVARYHAICRDRTLDHTPPGLSAMRDAMPGVVEKLRAAQEEAQEGITNAAGGRPADWWWIIVHLPPEQLALLTLRCVLAGNAKDGLGRARRVTSLSLMIADAVRLQMEYERWVRAEREAKRQAKREGKEHDDLLSALKSRVKEVDAQSVRRWWKKIGKVRDETWTTTTKIAVGTKLMDLLVQGAGGWFELQTVFVGAGKTERHIVLTDTAVLAMEDVDQRASLAAPLRLPMICPPKPWVFIPKPQKEAA